MTRLRATDETPGRQGQTTGTRALKNAASWVKVVLLASALAVGVASTATAAPLVINTDSTWLATNQAPGAGWNTDPTYNTSSWQNATVVIPDCHGYGFGDCIWYDGQFSATQSAWFRQTFTISSPVSAAFLIGGVDDDADVYLNGTLVYTDHDGWAHDFGPLNVAPYLVQGVNLIAVSAWDNVPVFGQNHAYLTSLTVYSPDPTQAPVPEPASLLLLGSGLSGLAAIRRKRHR